MRQKSAILVKDAITIIGLGAVGSALAQALSAAGCPRLLLVGRGRAHEKTLARRLHAQYTSRITGLDSSYNIVIVAVKDTDLPQVVADLANLPLTWPKLTVLHTAGALGSEVLKPLQPFNAGLAAWHPYQTFPKKARRMNLEGITWGVDGNRKGVIAANRLSRSLGGKPLRIVGEDRVLYHLSAVLACGFITADLQMAVKILQSPGIPEARSLETVLPIARETLRQISELGLQEALTGPAVRGDTATIQKHRKALRKLDPGTVKVYEEVSRYLLADLKRRQPKRKA
jgi:predicted short-subunit dehydrogenase-like oxidoreductase (DUF2520 family)